MQKVVFFPHSDKEFGDEDELRAWLDSDLRIDRNGCYHLKKANCLGELGKGSTVFFT